ncbi:hypothetical protein ACN27G_36365 [Plantactinospora sp. WMMB334]
MTSCEEDRLGRQLAVRLDEEIQTMTAPSNLTATLHRRHARRT